MNIPSKQEELYQYFKDLAGFDPEETAAFCLWCFTNQDREMQLEDLRQWFNKRIEEQWDEIHEDKGGNKKPMKKVSTLGLTEEGLRELLPLWFDAQPLKERLTIIADGYFLKEEAGGRADGK